MTFSGVLLQNKLHVVVSKQHVVWDLVTRLKKNCNGINIIDITFFNEIRRE